MPKASEEFIELIAIPVFICVVPLLIVAGVMFIDYHISSEATVNAINEQCSTNYRRSDYLRVGKEAMLQMCEIRERRFELKRKH